MSNGVQRPQFSVQDTYIFHGSNCQMQSQSNLWLCGMQNVALLRNIIYGFQQLHFIFTVTEADPESQAWHFGLTSYALRYNKLFWETFCSYFVVKEINLFAVSSCKQRLQRCTVWVWGIGQTFNKIQFFRWPSKQYWDLVNLTVSYVYYTRHYRMT